jgi:hypothetical protein
MVRCSASSAAVAINVAPLDVSLRMRAIALLNTVQCNGQPAFEKSFLIGIGTPLPLWIQWGISWSSATTGVKYYQENSAIGKEHLAQYNEDFGVTTNGLSADSYELMDDAALLPATALAVVPGTWPCFPAHAPLRSHTVLVTSGFNVPELRGLTLVLDFETMAAIYLGKSRPDLRKAGLMCAEQIASPSLDRANHYVERRSHQGPQLD